MASGALLALLSLYFVWRRSGDPKTHVLAATTLGSEWRSRAAANLFPEALGRIPNCSKPISA